MGRELRFRISEVDAWLVPGLGGVFGETDADAVAAPDNVTYGVGLSQTTPARNGASPGRERAANWLPAAY